MRVGYRKRTTAGDKTICLPLPDGVVYDEWIEDSVGYRQYLNEQIAEHPELFPPEIGQGYWLDGFVTSKRQQMKTRRIILKANRQVYQIRPDTVLPYMIGVAVGCFADPDFPAPQVSLYEQRRHRWVEVPAGTVRHERGVTL